jgi:PAS domain-containing protein
VSESGDLRRDASPAEDRGATDRPHQPERLFGGLLEVVPDGAVAVDRAGSIVDVNAWRC